MKGVAASELTGGTGGAGGGNRGGGGIQEVKSFIALAARVGVEGTKSGGGGGGLAWLKTGTGGQCSRRGDGDGVTRESEVKDSTLPFRVTGCSSDALAQLPKPRSVSSATLRPLFLAHRA